MLFWNPFPKEALTQLNDSSIFPVENHFQVLCPIQSSFLHEEALRVEERRTLWVPIVSAAVATKRQTQHRWRHCAVRINNAPASVLFGKSWCPRVSCNEASAAWHLAYVDCNAAQPETHIQQLAMDAAFLGQFLLRGKPCTPPCEQIAVGTLIPNWCSRYFLIATAEKVASLFVSPGSQLRVFTLQRGITHWQRRFKRSVS